MPSQKIDLSEGVVTLLTIPVPFSFKVIGTGPVLFHSSPSAPAPAEFSFPLLPGEIYQVSSIEAGENLYALCTGPDGRLGVL